MSWPTGSSTKRSIKAPEPAAILSRSADVAQLARASACHAEGRGFESHHPLLRSPGNRGFLFSDHATPFWRGHEMVTGGRMVQMNDAQKLREAWIAKGDPPCDHPETDVEYHLGSQTGDVACMVC